MRIAADIQENKVVIEISATSGMTTTARFDTPTARYIADAIIAAADTIEQHTEQEEEDG